MQLSHELVESFQRLHLDRYGESISYEVAESQLQQLADLIRMTAQTKDPK